MAERRLAAYIIEHNPHVRVVDRRALLTLVLVALVSVSVLLVAAT
jgi:hypothetical protein